MLQLINGRDGAAVQIEEFFGVEGKPDVEALAIRLAPVVKPPVVFLV